SKYRELELYQFVVQKLLEDRFRNKQGNAYSVSRQLGLQRGAGFVQLDLQPNPETYWQQLKEVKELVWGDLAPHLSQKDYARYKATLSEYVAHVREETRVHERIRRAIQRHPLHLPPPDEARPP